MAGYSDIPENPEKTVWYKTALHVHEPIIRICRRVREFTGEPMASIIRRAIIVGIPIILREEESKRLALLNAAQKTHDKSKTPAQNAGDEQNNSAASRRRRK